MYYQAIEQIFAGHKTSTHINSEILRVFAPGLSGCLVGGDGPGLLPCPHLHVGGGGGHRLVGLPRRALGLRLGDGGHLGLGGRLAGPGLSARALNILVVWQRGGQPADTTLMVGLDCHALGRHYGVRAVWQPRLSSSKPWGRGGTWRGASPGRLC
jgi:hypothetical protein